MKRKILQQLIKRLETVDSNHFFMRKWITKAEDGTECGCAFYYLNQIVDEDLWHTQSSIPWYNGLEDYQAIEEFLELSDAQVDYIFNHVGYQEDGFYTTPDEVIERIKEVLDEGITE